MDLTVWQVLSCLLWRASLLFGSALHTHHPEVTRAGGSPLCQFSSSSHYLFSGFSGELTHSSKMSLPEVHPLTLISLLWELKLQPCYIIWRFPRVDVCQGKVGKNEPEMALCLALVSAWQSWKEGTASIRLACGMSVLGDSLLFTDGRTSQLWPVLSLGRWPGLQGKGFRWELRSQPGSRVPPWSLLLFLSLHPCLDFSPWWSVRP